MNYKDFYSHILNEVVIPPNSLQSSIYSAFKLALDLDDDQIGNVFEPDISYTSIGIATDHRVPKKSITSILGFFTFYYKASYYKIKFNIINWNDKPVSSDFNDYAHGKNLKSHTDAIKKLPVDTSKPLTGIIQVYQSDVKKGPSGLYETDEEQIGQLGGKNSTFDQYILPNGSFYELAKDVKKLIDKGGSKEQKEEPVETPPYANSPVHSPELALTEEIETKYIQDGQLQSDDGEDIPDFWEQINELEKSSGISILRGKELNVVLVEDGEVLGALYTELQNSSKGEEFSFDLIVKPEHRNKGLGDKLVKLGLDDYKSLKNGYNSKIKLKIDVVNPLLINTFKKNGLTVIKQDGGHTHMSY
jgi:ribosomal protein S18 acetylase RimI-like enzyme